MKKFIAAVSILFASSTSFSAEFLSSSTGDAWADEILSYAIKEYVIPVADKSSLGKLSGLLANGSFKYDAAKRHCFGFSIVNFGFKADPFLDKSLLPNKVSGIILTTETVNSSNSFFYTDVSRNQCEQHWITSVAETGKNINSQINRKFNK